jgi:hypothetical protein
MARMHMRSIAMSIARRWSPVESFAKKHQHSNAQQLPKHPSMASIPFAQYNVLSSSLCEPTWYTESAAEDLDPKNRLPRVQDKLQQQIILTGGRVIIALQEVSMAWLGPLDTWFAERGYKFLCSLYGNPKNDFMGVALAVPLAHYDVLETAVCCVGEAQQWGREPAELRPGDWICPACQATCFASRSTCFKCKEPKPVEPSALGDQLKSAVLGAKALLLLVIAAVTLSSLWLPAVKWVLAKLGLYKPPKKKSYSRPQKSIWKQSQEKYNRLVYFRLVPKGVAGAPEFGVATYHMPCVFWEPAIMVIHAALCTQRTQILARGAPCVLLGDFNFKPGDAAYRLVTEGALDESDPHYPVAPAWEPWRPTLDAMRSAYASLGGEPAYTNHTVSGMNPAPFTDTLDYIFYSGGSASGGGDHWEPLSVLPTPPSTELIERCKAPQPSPKRAGDKDKDKDKEDEDEQEKMSVPEIADALRAAGQAFCPNRFEPSDHLMIAAELRLLGPSSGSSNAKAKRSSSKGAAARKRRPSNPVGGQAVQQQQRARSPSTSPPPRRRSTRRVG